MSRRIFLLGMTFLVCLSTTLIDWASAPVPEAHAGSPPATMNRFVNAYGQLPLSFEANQGQADPQVEFLARGRGYGLFLTSTEAVLRLRPPAEPREGESDSGVVLRMKLAGANPAPAVVGSHPLPGKSNYFLGNDPSRWRTDVPHFARAWYEDVYPGVDLEFYGTQQGELEYDFVIAPGTDPSVITLALEEAQRVEVDGQGDLHVGLGTGEIQFRKPVLYQEADGERQEVRGRFVLRGRGQVGIDVGAYDSTQPLVIDPVLVYSTYLGGSVSEGSGGIAVDAAGNTYLTGFTSSTNFPPASPIQGTFGGGSFDVTVTKLNAAGDALVYSTYLGGNDRDTGGGMAVDSAGNVYVTGDTASANFPTVNPLQPTYGGQGIGFGDAFVAKLNPAGNALLYSTYLGGSDDDQGLGIAVDAAGSAYVVGQTKSANFPTANPLKAAKTGTTDAFVAKVNAAGSALVYSTYLGGSLGEMFTGQGGVTVDAAGNAYVVGSTQSSNFPTVNAFQATYGGHNELTYWGDAFVTKLNPAGSALVYSTFLGGSDDDRAYSIAVDAAGNASVTGLTGSSNFPLANPIQGTNGGGTCGSVPCWDVFVTKLNPAGSALVYSTYLGGGNNDSGHAIAVNSGGEVFVTGFTRSSNFPTTDPLQATNAGNADAFVTKLNAAGSALVYSTYLGGSGDDFGNGIAVDAFGNGYVTGRAHSTNFPTANPVQAANAGDSDIFVAKVGAPAAGVLYGVTACCPNQLVSIDPASGGLTVLGTVGDASTRFALGAAAGDASTHRLFLAERSSPRLMIVNTITGGTTEKALGQELLFLGFESNAGTLYGVTACCPNQLVRIDTATGGLTEVGTVGGASDEFAGGAAAVDPGGKRFFLAKRTPSGLLIIDTTTGGTTEKALSQEMLFLGFETSTGTLFGVTACCPNQFVSIDTGTGALTAEGIVGWASYSFAGGAVALDPDSKRFFLARRFTPRLVTINTTTGASTETVMAQEIICLGFD